MPTIFLADSNPYDGMLLELGFAEVGQPVEIVQALDGAEAFDILRAASLQTTFQFNLIALNLRIPKIDGLELLDLLHDELGLTGVPMVILTASVNPIDRQRSLAHSPSAYLTKNLDYDGLGIVINNLMPYLFIDQASSLLRHS